MIFGKLRYAFPVKDQTILFNISSSTVIYVLIIWFDFLHMDTVINSIGTLNLSSFREN